MDALISKFQVTNEVLEQEKKLATEGIIVRPYERSDLVPFLNFLSENMPGPWLEDARRNLIALTRGLFDEDAILLAMDGNRIIGYCQYEREHFGPFGVSNEYQGRGVGSVLLARTLERMRQKGYHSAWVLWTGMRAARGVYGRLGFSVTRRFALMKKTL
jgi:ribosomal protein S18 acetylase RimI-like enzyme